MNNKNICSLPFKITLITDNTDHLIFAKGDGIWALLCSKIFCTFGRLHCIKSS